MVGKPSLLSSRSIKQAAGGGPVNGQSAARGRSQTQTMEECVRRTKARKKCMVAVDYTHSTLCGRKSVRKTHERIPLSFNVFNELVSPGKHHSFLMGGLCNNTHFETSFSPTVFLVSAHHSSKMLFIEAEKGLLHTSHSYFHRTAEQHR